MLIWRDFVMWDTASAGTLRGIKLGDLLQMDVGALTTLLPRITEPTLTAADVSSSTPSTWWRLPRKWRLFSCRSHSGIP